MKITSIQIRTCVGQLENIIKSKDTSITPELIRACLDPIKNNLTHSISDRAQRNLLTQLQALLSKASTFTHSKKYIEALSAKIASVLDRKEEKENRITQAQNVQIANFKNHFEALPTILEEDETPYMAIPNTASDEKLEFSKVEENNKEECLSDSGLDSPTSDDWIEDPFIDSQLEGKEIEDSSEFDEMYHDQRQKFDHLEWDFDLERKEESSISISMSDTSSITSDECESLSSFSSDVSHHNANSNEIEKTTDQTELHKAVLENHWGKVRNLLEEKADPNAKDAQDQAPLHIAAGNKNATLIVGTLLEYHADSNARNEKGQTPLHIAATKGHTEIVNTLLRHRKKVDVNAQDNHNRTPLHKAANAKYLWVVSSLLAHGADVDIRDKNGNTAAKITQSPEIKQVLKEAQLRDNRSAAMGAMFFKHQGSNNLADNMIKPKERREAVKSQYISFSSQISALRIKLFSLITRANKGKDIMGNINEFIQKYVEPLQGILTPENVKSYDYTLLRSINEQLKQLYTHLNNIDKKHHDRSVSSDLMATVRSFQEEITHVLIGYKESIGIDIGPTYRSRKS